VELAVKYYGHAALEDYCWVVWGQVIEAAVYVQGDQKVSVHLMITIQKVTIMFKVSPASLQTFIDTRDTLMPSVIPNSNYVIMVSDWNCLKYFCMFFVQLSSGAQRLFDHPVDA
jgi:hypothetical protein